MLVVPKTQPAATPRDLVLTERQRIAHLLGRAGFGASGAELDAFSALGFEGAVDRLLDFEKVDDPAGDALDPIGDDVKELYQIQQRWLARMLHTRRPLVEKLTLFWHDHFATGIRKVRSAPVMWRQIATLRHHALGNFEAMALALAQDPAMLIWLDGVSSRRGNPNENFAREFLELFTLGVGNYSEDDVREAARAFTGYSLDVRGRDERHSAEFVFRNQWHDTGYKLFLGEVGRWRGEDIVRIAVQNPATARHLARKLFALFAYPDAGAATIEPFADVFRATDGDLRAVTRAILTSDAFLSEPALRAQVKSPVDFAIGAMKALDVPFVPEWTWLSLRGMGQELFSPPNVGGWSSGIGWINHQTVLERFACAARLAYLEDGAWTSPSLEGAARLEEVQSRPQDVVDEFLLRFGAAPTDDASRDTLTDYLRLDADGRPSARPAELAGQRLRGLAQLVMSMPGSQIT